MLDEHDNLIGILESPPRNNKPLLTCVHYFFTLRSNLALKKYLFSPQTQNTQNTITITCSSCASQYSTIRSLIVVSRKNKFTFQVTSLITRHCIKFYYDLGSWLLVVSPNLAKSFKTRSLLPPSDCLLLYHNFIDQIYD